CLRRLQERGFIVAMTKGAFSWKKRHATEWRLTEHVCNVSGHGPTSEYRNWRPEIQNAVAVVKPIGSCGETNVAKRTRDGSCGETNVAKRTRDGSCGETVGGQKSDSQLHHSYTLSCQVPPSARSAPSCLQARSTPEWAGYTSLPVELRLLALGLSPQRGQRAQLPP